jgi:hypothetical protein
MAAVDAQTYWMSAKIPNDQFLLFAFDGVPSNIGQAVDELRRRAQCCAELRLRVDDGCKLRYPRWVPGAVGPEQFVVHDLDDDGWPACLHAVALLAAEQLDVSQMAWRAHVFPSVRGVPAAGGPSSVVVVQLGHALGDGTRSAALSAVLFGRDSTVPAVFPPRSGSLLRRGWQASRAQRHMVEDTEAGLLPPPGQLRPVLSINARPTGVGTVRTLVRQRSQLAGPTVTIAVLVAVSDALSGYLRDRGEDPSQLGAEVPMVKAVVPQANNNFRNVGVGLHPELSAGERAGRIEVELAGHRRRGEHPAMSAASRAFAAVPAPLLRWGIAQFDPKVRSPVVTGNTVVSSVNRGAADLRFGSALVAFTAGYPALSPMMSLTHGVHGIGDTVAVSVHAAEENVDIDDYVARLDTWL